MTHTTLLTPYRNERDNLSSATVPFIEDRQPKTSRLMARPETLPCVSGQSYLRQYLDGAIFLTPLQFIEV